MVCSAVMGFSLVRVVAVLEVFTDMHEWCGNSGVPRVPGASRRPRLYTPRGYGCQVCIRTEGGGEEVARSSVSCGDAWLRGVLVVPYGPGCSAGAVTGAAPVGSGDFLWVGVAACRSLCCPGAAAENWGAGRRRVPAFAVLVVSVESVGSAEFAALAVSACTRWCTDWRVDRRAGRGARSACGVGPLCPLW